MSAKVVDLEDNTEIRIYPCYIDSSKTIAEGRRVSKEFTVDNPNAYSIGMCLNELGFHVKCDMKIHPRDFFTYGCVDVKLKAADGTPVKSEFPSKLSLLKHIKSIYKDLPVPMEMDPEASLRSEFEELKANSQKDAPAAIAAPTSASAAATAAKKKKKK